MALWLYGTHDMDRNGACFSLLCVSQSPGTGNASSAVPTRSSMPIILLDVGTLPGLFLCVFITWILEE